jgi:S-(hydroxymethyl)glutathione dehydrogenase/alcohol dehydrogenase
MNGCMKASVFIANNEPLVVEDVTLDPPGDGEVHVKWNATGVCHSDVSIWNGTLPIPAPCILGHEGAGVVVAAGKNKTGFKTGDHVIGSFVPTCGECFYCRNDQAYICEKSIEIGMSRMPFTRPDGSKLMGAVGGLAAFAEETVVSETAIVKIPNDFSLEEASLIGCGVTTGVGAALFAAKVTEGSTCVVIGCGGVGEALIQGCRIAKAERIIAADINPSKLKAAEEFGATHTVNPNEKDLGEFVRGLNEGRLADFAFEVVGVPALQRQAYDVTRPGGTCCWVGVPNVMSETNVPGALLVLENKRLVGTIYGSANVRRDFIKMIDYAKAGELDLKDMISQRIGVGDVNDAFKAMLDGDVRRSVVVFD